MSVVNPIPIRSLRDVKIAPTFKPPLNHTLIPSQDDGSIGPRKHYHAVSVELTDYKNGGERGR